MQCAISLRRLLPVLLPLGVPALIAAGPAPATARHLALKHSDPADQSRLSVSPERISLWFTARPQLAYSRITLAGEVGSIALDTIVADTGNALHARIPRALAPGRYRVAWLTSSADGHPIRGDLTFTVLGASPATISTPDVSRSAVADERVAQRSAQQDQTEYAAARWVEFVALITMLGALGFRHGVLPPLAARGVPTADAADRAGRLGQGALFLYGLAAITRLYTQSVALNGQPRALDPDALFALLARTSWGMGWTTGIIGALLLLVGWAIAKRGIALGTPLALTGALALAASPALTGHAASSNWFIAAVTLDVLHILAAGVWIGGLLMVLLAGVPAMRRVTDGNPDAAVSALVNSFHPVALFCAPVVVAAGLGTSILRLGGLTPLTTTRYGVTLLVKIGLFFLVVALASYNSMRARRALGTPEGTSRLRRTAALELGLAMLVIAATAVLVSTPAPSLMVRP